MSCHSILNLICVVVVIAIHAGVQQRIIISKYRKIIERGR